MPIYTNPPTGGGTSGVTDFAATRDVIVRRALRIVGNVEPLPEQLRDALTVMNSMLKAWSMEGFLWLRQFYQVTLVAGTNSYYLGPMSVPAIDRPLHVYNCNRKSTSGSEVPMIQLTRSDWMAIPNKTSTGTPVQYYYDAQMTNGVLYVWPTPQTGVTDVLNLDIDTQLDVMLDSENTYDFPPNWLDAITYNLADRVSPEYGMPLQERLSLKKDAAIYLSQASLDDRDLGSVRFEVRR